MLAAGGVVYFGRRGEWRLSPAWMGRRGAGGVFGPARCWSTATPYVTPFQGPAEAARPTARDPEHQLREEIGLRRLPKPVEVSFSPNVVRGSAVVRATDFVLSTKSRQPRPDASAAAGRIVFQHEVWGPLAFAFGAHFGLGLFEPVGEMEG